MFAQLLNNEEDKYLSTQQQIENLENKLTNDININNNIILNKINDLTNKQEKENRELKELIKSQNKIIEKLINKQTNNLTDIDKNINSSSSNSEQEYDKKNSYNKKYKSQDKKIKRKYKKTNIINDNLRYIEITDNANQVYKYTISKIYNKTNTISYYCIDTHCKARISIRFYNLQIEKETKIIKEEELIKINIIHDHSLNYEQHKYIRNKIIKEDFKNFNIQIIKQKCRDYNYRYGILKEIALKYPNIGVKGRLLENYFLDTFGNIEYDYNKISNDEKNKIIERYIKKCRKEKKNNIDIKDVINLNKQCASVSVLYNSIKKRKIHI